MRTTVATGTIEVGIAADRGRAFAPVLGLAALSGAAGLAHELLWTRRLIDLLGASGGSAARVFGCFFLGLALGSAWASRRVARVARPWEAAALAEVMVAVLAIPALTLPAWTGWLWPALGPEGLVGPLGGAAKLAISAAAIVPPAFAMGAVLPLLMPAALVGSARLGRQGVWLYAANTLGGVLGVVVTALITLPHLGSTGAMLAAMGGNLLVALGLFCLGCRQARASAGPGPSRVRDEAPSGQGIARLLPGLVAFLSGAGILAAEVVALELVMLAAPLSYHAPAAILAAVIGLLGIAAGISPGFVRHFDGGGASLPTAMAASGIAMVVPPLLFLGLARISGDLAYGATLPEFLLGLVLMVLASLGPAFLTAGLVFPATMAWSAEGDGRGSLGRLLALNGLGGLLGAEAAYGVLLPNCGIHGSLAAIGGLYALAGCVPAALGPRTGSRSGLAHPLIRPLLALLVVAILGIGPVRRLPHVNPYLGATILDEQFGREGAVAVVDGPGLGRAILLSNQYILGSTKGRWDQERQAHLPLLLHPDPRSVAFIGLATGMTPGAALEHGRVASITAVELSPLVARAADRFFADANHDVARNARARVVIEDGRTYMAASLGRFDVVVGDLFLPWAPGEGRLFSVEHFHDVRQSLRPGGLFCQWLPMYQLTPNQFALIAETFARVFPEVHLIRNGFGVRQPVVGLIGYRDGGGPDWAAVARRCAESRASGTVLDPTARHAGVVEMLYLGALPTRESDAPVNTLGNLRLELDAGRERITGDPGSKYLHGGRFLAWVEALGARPATLGDATSRQLTEAGLRLSAWELGETRRGRGVSPPVMTLPAPLTDLIPPDVRGDRDADWARWPGTPPHGPGGPGEAENPLTSRDTRS